MFQLALLAIIFAIVALSFNKGLWRNMITLVNALFAALLAMNYFEPLAEKLKGWNDTFDFLWDMLAAWLIFAFAMLALRIVTDRLTTLKVRFIKPVDLGGGIFFSLWTGWIVACFAAFTLHVSPLPRNAVEASPASSSFILAPDRLWLGFTQKQSYGALGRADSAADADYVFDPQGDFILRYAASRAKLEALKEKPEASTFRFPLGRNANP